MIAKRIRRGRRAARGSIRKLHRFVTALTRYLVDAHAADLVEIETGRRLTEYILDSDGLAKLDALGVEPGEKVVCSGARNLIGNSLESWQAQMLAVAARAVSCRDPVEHYVLSWQPGERPTETQFARAVEVAVEELGLNECQAIWAVHGNTDNMHVHIAVNRVHPISGKTQSAGDGWDKDRLQQVCALVEHEQGWRAEENAHYVVQDGEVMHRATNAIVRDREGRQTRARDRANEPKVISDTFEPIAKAIAAATDWRDLHDRMQALGARYERAGLGANVVRGEARIKPSKLGRDYSLPALEKRFGPYEPSLHLDGYARYKSQRNAERDRLRSAKEAALAAVESWHATQMSGLVGDIGSEIITLLVADLDARKATILAAIDSVFTSADATISAVRSERAWIAAGQPEAGVVAVPVILLPSPAAQPRGGGAGPEGLGAYSKDRTPTGIVEYRDKQGEVVLVDAGSVIVVFKSHRAELEAGLLLAAGRWSEVRFSGDARATEIVAQLAKLHQVRVVDAEGQVLLPKPPASKAAPAMRPGPPLVEELTPLDRDPAGIPARGSLGTGPLKEERAEPATQEPQHQPSVDDEGPDVIAHVHGQGRGRGR